MILTFFVADCVLFEIWYFSQILLFDGFNTKIRKQGAFLDVSMGAYDAAEVCELVGTYMLNALSKKYNKNDSGFTGMMDWLFSQIEVDYNQNR